MNNLDDLRDAMHTTPDFEPKPLDLDHVLAAGGRLRRRRRALAGGAAGLTVLVLLIGGAQLARPDSPAPSGLPAAAPSPAPEPEEPSQEPEDRAPLGEVVKTGMRTDGQDVVVWMRPIHEPALPDIAFGMALGRRTAAGELTVDIVTNETEVSALAPGFHGLEMPMGVDDQVTPAFGYFVGPAVKITAVANGRTVRAHQAAWSEDPSVKFLWFDRNQVKPLAKLGKAVAYDKDGRKLPAGNAGFAAG